MNSRARHSAETEEPTDRTNMPYDIRPRPKIKVQFTPAQWGNQQTITLPKTFAHIMLTQTQHQRQTQGIWQ